MDGLEAICGRCSAEGSRVMGTKFTPAGTRKAGGFYPMPGFMKVLDTSPHAPYSPLFVCEGFATAVALHHLSRGKVAVCAAFSIAGFGSCVESVRRIWPDVEVMLVPDAGEAYRLAHKAAFGNDREPVPTIPGASVVSFDGSSLATWLRPSATSVAIPFPDMGATAVRMLMDPATQPGMVERLHMPVLEGHSIRRT